MVHAHRNVRDVERGMGNASALARATGADGGAGSVRCAPLTFGRNARILHSLTGGALVSTWEMRQRRHAEDGSLASLILEPKHSC